VKDRPEPTRTYSKQTKQNKTNKSLKEESTRAHIKAQNPHTRQKEKQRKTQKEKQI